MSAIKNFFYLDEYKMYSISSQILEGITEYFTDFKSSSTEGTEQQSGPLFSGKVLADILRSESASQEKKFFHDYSYTLFERHLNGEDKILRVSEDNIADIIGSIDEAAFVAIKAKPIFNDMKLIMSMLDSFNQMGEALTYVTNVESFTQIQQNQDQQNLTPSGSLKGDKNRQARARQQQQVLEASLRASAKTQNLYMDPALLKHLKYLLQYGFQDNFEVRMQTSGYSFSANLKREYIRENEQLFVTKYSRFSEKEFVLFGTVAQCSSSNDEEGQEAFQATDPTHLKDAIMSMVGALSNIESTYNGRMPNEIIIDPIAVYREL